MLGQLILFFRRAGATATTEPWADLAVCSRRVITLPTEAATLLGNLKVPASPSMYRDVPTLPTNFFEALRQTIACPLPISCRHSIFGPEGGLSFILVPTLSRMCIPWYYSQPYHGG